MPNSPSALYGDTCRPNDHRHSRCLYDRRLFDLSRLPSMLNKQALLKKYLLQSTVILIFMVINAYMSAALRPQGCQRTFFSGIYIIALLFVIFVVMLRELDSCTDRLPCFLIIRNNARLVIG